MTEPLPNQSQAHGRPAHELPPAHEDWLVEYKFNCPQVRGEGGEGGRTAERSGRKRKKREAEEKALACRGKQ
jgi:hypothetical protein